MMQNKNRHRKQRQWGKAGKSDGSTLSTQGEINSQGYQETGSKTKHERKPALKVRQETSKIFNTGMDTNT